MKYLALVPIRNRPQLHNVSKFRNRCHRRRLLPLNQCFHHSKSRNQSLGHDRTKCVVVCKYEEANFLAKDAAFFESATADVIVGGHDQPATLSYNGYPDRIFRAGIEMVAMQLVFNLSGVKAIQERPIPAMIFVYEKSKRKIKRQ